MELLTTILVALFVTGAGSLNNNWCPKPCDCYNQYTTVDCTNKGLTKLPPLSNLTQYLFLDGNDITNLEGSNFYQTPNLLRLHIQNSKLKEIEAKSFCGLGKLQELHLGHNQLTSFQVGSGHECILPDLKELILSGNKLKEIPKNLSSIFPNLEILSLHNNELESAAVDESFGELKNLENLDVSLNHIHEIRKTDLDPIRSVIPLEILHLSDCGLVFIDPDAFVGMNNLTTLSLSRSLVSTLAPIFKHFSDKDSCMTTLDISEMLLPSLTSDMLGMFHKLILLDASYSGVEYIQPQLFNKLSNMETMHLESNRLTAIDNIGALTKLRRLYLSFNQLSEIDLRNLTNLEVVNLSGNKFEVIPADWVCDSDHLLMLNLSGNHIVSIDRHAFSRVSLNTLDLSHNQLHIVGPIGTIKLTILDLSHNQIITVSSEAFFSMSPSLGEVDLGHNQLQSLPLDIFEDCTSLQTLYLRHNNFGPSLQSETQRDLLNSLGHLNILDLSYNNIKSLPARQFSSLHHLTILNLQGNQISDLGQLNLPDLPALAKLIMSNNQLASINTEVISQVPNLELLDLSFNPYECTCNIVPFLSWLRTTHIVILEHKNQSRYSCSFPPALRGRYIFTYHPDPQDCNSPSKAHYHGRHHDLLQYQHWTIVGIVLGCIVALGVSFGLVLYFGHVCQHIKSLHYRWQVRYREVSGVEIAGDPKA